MRPRGGGEGVLHRTLEREGSRRAGDFAVDGHLRQQRQVQAAAVLRLGLFGHAVHHAG